MSASEVAAKYGSSALLRLAFAVLLYLTLRALRWPMLLTVRLLNVAMTRVDTYLTAGGALADATTPGGPSDAPRR